MASFRGSFNLTRPEELAVHCIQDVLRKTPQLDPQIVSGSSDAVIGGGVESITMTPRNNDSNPRLLEKFPGAYMVMGETAEVVLMREAVIVASSRTALANLLPIRRGFDAGHALRGAAKENPHLAARVLALRGKRDDMSACSLRIIPNQPLGDAAGRRGMRVLRMLSTNSGSQSQKVA